MYHLKNFYCVFLQTLQKINGYIIPTLNSRIDHWVMTFITINPTEQYFKSSALKSILCLTITFHQNSLLMYNHLYLGWMPTLAHVLWPLSMTRTRSWPPRHSPHRSMHWLIISGRFQQKRNPWWWRNLRWLAGLLGLYVRMWIRVLFVIHCTMHW